MITLSIIVTAHNLEKLILQCLLSIKNCIEKNTNRDIEVLLVDDCSSDDTSCLMNDFANLHDGYTYIRTEYGNIGKVRNYAINIANGKYITFIDGDDTIPNFSIKNLLCFLKNKEPDLLLSKMHEVRNEKDKIILSNLNKPKIMDKDKAIVEFLLHKKFQAHLWGKFFKKELFKNKTIPPLTCYEDSYIFPELLNDSTKIFYTDSVMYNYIKRENSLSAKIDNVKAEIKVDIINHMNTIFSKRKYYNLIICHAIDLLLKNREVLSIQKQKELKSLIKNTRKIKFLLDRNIRFSFKKKLLKC
ncbi:glycosyltransferase family 2 protein [Xenorhabdus bovienii]|uniref:glycosyltransferase family 2 protein n=1 Tax=Xenorhabdus bovienii TaxID=40576 RepID=UPI0001709F47|nr:glycosyltransferase family 2 protein [Xenorhabdus bovienii]MCG3472498.1 glycosyltransferase family 2 protein [Xenorhabdus bovienii]